MLIQAAYQSETAKPLTPQSLFHIQKAATTYNLQHDITACLYVDGCHIFQVLEGQARDVTRLINHIQNDPIHHNVEFLRAKDIKKRHFENWAFANFTPTDPILKRVLHSLQLDDITTLGVATRINILKLASAQKFWDFNRRGFRKPLTDVPTLEPAASQHAAA